MRTFFALVLGAFLSSQAVAAPAIVYQAPVSPDYFEISNPYFEVNPSLGRAWVQVTLFYRISDEWNNRADIVRIPVNGLYFDAASNTVLWNNIPCGTNTQRGVQPTGRCPMSKSRDIIPVDDGFSIRPVPHLTVYFDAI